MSHSVHIISKGYGPPDGRCLPCSGVSGRAIAAILPSSSRCHHKLLLSHSHVKFLSSLRCSSTTSTHKSIVVCNANSSSYRRNPDLPRQNNKQGFSRNRNNRPNGEKRDGFQDFEESENGSLLSVSGNHKFQATSTPGPREKEIVELFRKVQAQLRERAAMKEDKKVEVSQVKSKENETVDSLLKLLRKHSVQQGKRNTDTESSDFILDQPEQIVPSADEIEERSTKISNSNNHVKHEKQQVPSPNLSRPKSNFRKRSPVPEIKFQPIYTQGSVNSASHDTLAGRRKGTPFEPESNEIQKLKNEFDSELDESTFSEVNVLDEMSEYETSEIYEGDHDDVDEEQNQDETSKLNEMKLTELRALAKSRGLKGFSKLKKSELIDLLGDNSV